MISLYLSYQVIYEKFHSWSKRTTISPPNVYLSHLRALTQKCGVNDDQETFNLRKTTDTNLIL